MHQSNSPFSKGIFSSVVAIIGLMALLLLQSGAVASQASALRADVSRAAAQTAAIPRTQDGRPNLSGFWRRTSSSNNIEEQPAAPFTPAQKTLIIDPPDGRIPYQPWALEQRRINFKKYIDANGLCFSSGAPRTAYISPVNRIIQTPGYILHLLEEAHQYRIIYTDGRPYVGANIRLWQGSSVRL